MNGKDRLTFDELKEMNYLECVMKETLRMHPPIIMMMRRVLEDVQFKGHTIAKGTLVSVAPILAHNLPKFWTNPEKFDPERHGIKKIPFFFLIFLIFLFFILQSSPSS